MPSQSLNHEPDPPRRARWTLRSMMAVIALLALILGLVGWQVRQLRMERDRAVKAELEARAFRDRLQAAQEREVLARTEADQARASFATMSEQLRAEIERLRAEVERLRAAAEKDAGR